VQLSMPEQCWLPALSSQLVPSPAPCSFAHFWWESTRQHPRRRSSAFFWLETYGAFRTLSEADAGNKLAYYRLA
jgi:hypothetical protein